MADKLTYIPNDATQNYPFCRLELVVETFEKPTNQNSLKSPKFLGQQIRKRYYKTFGTSVIINPLLPLSSRKWYYYVDNIFFFKLAQLLYNLLKPVCPLKMCLGKLCYL